MSRVQEIYLALIVLNAFVNLPSLLHLLTQRKSLMALNFAPLQAAAAEVGTNATTLQAQAAASDDASNQAAIDAVTQSLTQANAALTSLIVPAAQ